MRLVNAGAVLTLTGLSADQLREWTTRRGLILPDEIPNGPGSRAGYSWQTVLLLRVAKVLKENFHIELQAYRNLFNALSAKLAKAPFPSLQGKAIVVASNGVTHLHIVALEDVRMADADMFLIRLDPHLDVLSRGFGLPNPMPQLPLFPAIVVR